MNRTTATCIAGMRSEATSRSKIQFLGRVNFRLFAFGVGIFATRLLERPRRNPPYFELCECSESVILVTLTP